MFLCFWRPVLYPPCLLNLHISLLPSFKKPVPSPPTFSRKSHLRLVLYPVPPSCSISGERQRKDSARRDLKIRILANVRILSCICRLPLTFGFNLRVFSQSSGCVFLRMLPKVGIMMQNLQ